MDKYWKTKWIEALRSGNYRQGTGHLRNDEDVEDTFCCLGVLCDIVPQAVWTEVREEFDERFHVAVFEDSEDGTVLPRSVASLVGLPDGNPDIMITSDRRSTLAEENDNGMTFEEIADIIEEQF